MSGRACGLCTCESLRRLSRGWITVGKPKCTAFDFHWFKLGPNCCGDPVGDSFMSCLFKLPFFFPLTKMAPVHVRVFFSSPYRHVHISSPGGTAALAQGRELHVRQVLKTSVWIIVLCVLAPPQSRKGSCLICSG